MTTQHISRLIQVHLEERWRSSPPPWISRSVLQPPPSQIPISPGNHGTQALKRLVDSIGGQTQNQDNPIVFVSGFSGWGRPLFGTLNYWGGFENLPEILGEAGYRVIVVRIGPVSSNRERACEIWAQLKNINREGSKTGYDVPSDAPTQIDNIQYGNEHPAEHLGYMERAKTWKPVVFGDIPDDWNWQWGNESPVHFICHSQGGNSVRYLIEMLKGTHTDLFPGSHFPTEDLRKSVRSVVTIATPYKGTSVTDVVQRLFPPNFFELLTRLVWSTSFYPPISRFYDLQLDHWGFFKDTTESLTAMHTRLANLVPIWWNFGHHGLYENSILGLSRLNDFAPKASKHTYYFTMSFCATDPFPNRTLSQQDINEFLALFPFNEIINPFGLWGAALQTVFQIFSLLPFLPQLRNFAQWVTDVANRHLGSMGYFSRIPKPGSQIPRPDMLPVLAVPAYGMGGYQLSDERLRALGGVSSEKFQRNDGIVNTESMTGPVDGVYGEESFPGPGIDMTNMATAKGKYWHLGENATMDHADQIGVFTSETTAIEVSFMYLLLANLVTRLQE